MNFESFVTTFLSLLAICCGVSAEDEPKVSELFSFEKLAQYSSLASCFALIHEDFAYCNQKAEEKGRKYLEGVDPDSEWARRVKCCGTWKLRDCWVKFARDKCDAKQAEQVYGLPYTFMKRLDVSCRDYPDGSDKCRFPVWLIVTIVLVGVALLAAGVFCGVRFYRRRKERLIRQQLQSRAAQEERETLKPSPV
ncbi:unnamed protein product [Medioppia subpectinata]|uniref:Uncharacterized protein n=1 Tax=Medioppia subpectinata TaxID=1979941 RepID=A0A7R9Q059_9ACAR|nr:unnamed protein product [Medioppia subpectinata]CAG2106885.1 unnamed protein product [Medioppia subpectinata]